jgi:hypothetical protein
MVEPGLEVVEGAAEDPTGEVWRHEVFAWEAKRPDAHGFVRWFPIVVQLTSGFSGMLVTTSRFRAESKFASYARQHMVKTGQPVRLVRLQVAEVIQ